LLNAFEASSLDQTLRIFKLGALQTVSVLLKSDEEDLISLGISIVSTILEAGENLVTDENHVNPYIEHLRDKRIFSQLKELQDHSSEEIYENVTQILEVYIPLEEKE